MKNIISIIDTKYVASILLLLISISGYADFNTLRDGHSKLSSAKIDMPKLHASYTDPVFGTTIKRITVLHK